MAQLLLIKTADTPLKTIGDVIGIYEDKHIFSEHELLVFDVVRVMGIREEVAKELDELKYSIQIAYRVTDTKWSLTRPEKKQVWKDTDDKWYFLENDPKYRYSMSTLTPSEKTTLETNASGLERENALKKMIVRPWDWHEGNRTEVTDLNIAVIRI